MKKYSPFDTAVWKACERIPKGEVRSYDWIARQIKRPKAARAVAQALARNPFSPRVPCHRVIRKDGGLGGFSAPGGVKRKRELLRQEGVVIRFR